MDHEIYLEDHNVRLPTAFLILFRPTPTSAARSIHITQGPAGCYQKSVI
jgi:hypothetical protein